jgi:peptide/nickel transport system permease protein
MRERLLTSTALLLLLAVAPVVLMLAGRARDPYTVDIAQRYLPPGLSSPFGTDGLGRDMLARTCYALGISLQVALQSMCVSFVLALLLGGLAGYTAGRWPDAVISGIIALLFTVPFILIVVAIFAVMEPSLERAYLVIGCIAWAAPARLVRAEVMQVRSSQYILAERAYGFSESWLLFRSILPVCLFPAFLSLLYFLPELIGIEVGLSFFGLGAAPPTPTLGRLIYDGLSEFYTAWWLPVLPAVVLFAVTSMLALAAAALRKSSAWVREGAHDG